MEKSADFLSGQVSLISNSHLDIPGGDQMHALLLAEPNLKGEAPALRPTVEGMVLGGAGGHEAALRARGVGRLAAEETRLHCTILSLAEIQNLSLSLKSRDSTPAQLIRLCRQLRLLSARACGGRDRVPRGGRKCGGRGRALKRMRARGRRESDMHAGWADFIGHRVTT